MQIWANCRLYNSEGSDIAKICKRMEKQVLNAWKAAGLPRKQPVPMSPHPPAAGGVCIVCTDTCTAITALCCDFFCPMEIFLAGRELLKSHTEYSLDKHS